MSNDLVKQLREVLGVYSIEPEAADLCKKAADRIVELEESLHLANGTADLAMKHRDEAEAENARLRACSVRLTTDRSSPYRG